MNKWFNLSGLLFLFAMLIVSNGCRSPYYSDQLTLAGGVTGAGLGAMVGESTGNPESGALIGAVAGAMTGNILGHAMDAEEARNRAMIQSQMGREMEGAATLHDVMAMSQADLSDEIIIRHIQYSRMAAPPTSNDLVLLSQAGVSDRVIQAVQEFPLSPPSSGVPPRVIVEEHYLGPPPSPWHCHHYDFHHGHHSHGPRWGFSFHH